MHLPEGRISPMRQYNTAEPRLQAVNTVKNDKEQQKATRIYCDLDTGKAVEGLRDEKFPWRQWKRDGGSCWLFLAEARRRHFRFRWR